MQYNVIAILCFISICVYLNPNVICMGLDPLKDIPTVVF